MFTLDNNLRHIAASRDQIVALHQSLNSPHVAIPGKQAGPAHAFIVALRAQGGFSVYVYLYLAEVPDCAIYVPGRRSVSSEEYGAEESEAISFLESMGFMMETMNFQASNPKAQSELLRTLPMFKRDLRRVLPAPQDEARPSEPPSELTKLIGRILSSF